MRNLSIWGLLLIGVLIAACDRMVAGDIASAPIQKPIPKPNFDSSGTADNRATVAVPGRFSATLSVQVDGHVISWTLTSASEPASRPSLRAFRIDLDTRTMWNKQEGRRFRVEEQAAVIEAVDTLDRDDEWTRALLGYALESTDWWDHGKGEPVPPRPTAGICPIWRFELPFVQTFRLLPFVRFK